MDGHAFVARHLSLEVRQKFNGFNFNCSVEKRQNFPQLKFCAIQCMFDCFLNKRDEGS